MDGGDLFDLPGRDKYEVEDEIGHGTFSEVHQGRDRGTGELVALKHMYLQEEGVLPRHVRRELRLSVRIFENTVLMVRSGKRSAVLVHHLQGGFQNSMHLIGQAFHHHGEPAAPAVPAHTRRNQVLKQRRQRSASPAPQQQQQQQQQAPRVIPVEGPSCPKAHQPAAGAPSEPAAAAAASQPATAAATDKGKAPASPKQVAAAERRRRVQTAAACIAAGVGSDSDWEEADGAVSDCSLDK